MLNLNFLNIYSIGKYYTHTWLVYNPQQRAYTRVCTRWNIATMPGRPFHPLEMIGKGGEDGGGGVVVKPRYLIFFFCFNCLYAVLVLNTPLSLQFHSVRFYSVGLDLHTAHTDKIEERERERDKTRKGCNAR